jgi:hypothetical protein
LINLTAEVKLGNVGLALIAAKSSIYKNLLLDMIQLSKGPGIAITKQNKDVIPDMVVITRVLNLGLILLKSSTKSWDHGPME